MSHYKQGHLRNGDDSFMSDVYQGFEHDMKAIAVAIKMQYNCYL